MSTTAFGVIHKSINSAFEQKALKVLKPKLTNHQTAEKVALIRGDAASARWARTQAARKAVVHKALTLPKSAVFHGTTTKAATSIKRRGLDGQVGAHGNGAYLTPDRATASSYALKPSPFSTSTKAKDWQDGTFQGADRRKGKMLVFDPKAKPKTVVPKTAHGGVEINVFKPGDVGKPIHSQTVNRTSAERAIRREYGFKSDYEELKSTRPKSLVDPQERTRRLAVHRAKKAAKDRSWEDFL